MTVNNRIRDALVLSFDGPKKFVLAVSGGPDSQCLLKAFPHVSKKLGHEVVGVVGCNHGFRPEADSELDLSEKLSKEIGVPFHRIQLNIVKNGPSIQAQARDARYAALRAFARENGADYIVTGHHSDDKVETILIRLLRGKNIGSLAVLNLVSNDIFRPMLNLKREDIDLYLKRWGIPFATDPSNKNKKYLRSRVRHELLPLLEELSPSIRERLLEISREAESLKTNGY